MTPDHGSPGAALTVALAMAAGMGAQVVARHLRLPGIVLLLAAGVALGPDVAGLVDPASLGSGLHVIVVRPAALDGAADKRRRGLVRTTPVK